VTKETHRLRHVALHRMLDELVADFLRHGVRFDLNKPMAPCPLPSNTTVADLMAWSHQQTIEPAHDEVDDATQLTFAGQVQHA